MEKMEILKGFYLVSVMEYFQDDMDLLMGLMDLPYLDKKENVSGVDHQKIFTLDKYWEDRIRKEHKDDYKLYEHFLID